MIDGSAICGLSWRAVGIIGIIASTLGAFMALMLLSQRLGWSWITLFLSLPTTSIFAIISFVGLLAICVAAKKYNEWATVYFTHP